MTKRESGDELWEEFVKEFEKNTSAPKPGPDGPDRQPAEQSSRRRLLLPAAAALLVAAGAAAYLLRPGGQEPAAAPASAVTAVPAATGATAPPPSAPASNDMTAQAGAPTEAVPLSVFPARVQGYTRLSAEARASCTGTDTVAATLAGLITQSQGCLGVELALYKDADGNQYNLGLLTLKDQGDLAHVMTVLGSHPESRQVAIHLPPKDSGLRTLPLDSAFVQRFSAYGHSMLVGSAQWSDGRSSDLDQLSKLLAPLTDAVIADVPA
ncbi:hypothetical protein ABTY61_41415 [Kitasatospora sp. NPDC096128]|uniref:hypothetical protein n=1 Tax=Kitasatospora sp. NPDC096128 TaxID=3155547 RepID=UPI00332E2EBC